MKRKLKLIVPIALALVMAVALVITGCPAAPVPVDEVPVDEVPVAPEVPERVTVYDPPWPAGPMPLGRTRLYPGCRETEPREPLAPLAPDYEKTTWHLRLQSGVGGGSTVEIVAPLGDDVAWMSGGRVIIDSYASCELVPDEEIMDAIGKGTIDMGCTGIDYCTEPCIAFCMGWLPWVQEGGYDHECLFWMGWREIYQQAFNDVNSHYLYAATWDPGYLLTSKPINHLSDFEGMKLIGTEGQMGLLERFGAVPTYIPPEEYYLAISTGVMDGVSWMGARDGYHMGMHECSPYILTPEMTNPMYGFININLDVWNSMPSDIQGILTIAAHRWGLTNRTLYLADDLYYREKGNFITTALPDDEFKELFAECVKYWDEKGDVCPYCREGMDILIAWNLVKGRITEDMVPQRWLDRFPHGYDWTAHGFWIGTGR